MKISFNPAISVRQKMSFISFGGETGAASNPVIKQQPASDTFEKSSGKEPLVSLDFMNDNPYEDFFTRTKKLEISDYDAIGEREITKIIRSVEPDNMTAANSSAHFGYKLKGQLDRKYGKDNYVFVSIGVKPSLIGKAFECMGVETKYLPTPRSRKWIQRLRDNDIKQYGAFLKSQGLDKETIKNSHKKYLFYDYTQSDGHLLTFQNLMTSKFVLPKDKIEYRSLGKDLRRVKNINDDSKEFYINRYFVGDEAEKYSSIGYLPPYNLTKSDFSPQRITRHGDMAVKHFNIVVMNRLNRINALDVNPENDTAL